MLPLKLTIIINSKLCFLTTFLPLCVQWQINHMAHNGFKQALAFEYLLLLAGVLLEHNRPITEVEVLKNCLYLE